MKTRAWLNVEAKMSCDRCATCKHVVYCACSGDYPSSSLRVATQCREYESLDSAPALEWDLKDLMKLWTRVDEGVPTE